MTLYFINTPITPYVRKQLHSYTVRTALPNGGDTSAVLAMVTLKSVKDIKTVESIQGQIPNAFLVAIIPDSKATPQDWPERLACFVNDIASKDWPNRFHFLLRTALERRESGALLERVSAQANLLLHQLESNLEMAENVQRAILPRSTPEIPGVNISVKYLPASGLGGDYYDIFGLGDRRRFGILVADSQSHGLAAALLGVLLKVRVEEMKELFPTTNEFLDFISRELFERTPHELHRLNLLYGIFDRSDLSFEFTAAGSLIPLLVRKGTLQSFDSAVNPALGGISNPKFSPTTLQLKPLDYLILHTDGLILPKAKFGSIIKEFFSQPKIDTLRFQNEVLSHVRTSTQGGPLKDDLTLISLNIVEHTLYLAAKEKTLDP